MTVVLTTLYRLRTQWVVFLAFALGGSALAIVLISATTNKIDAIYEVETSAPPEQLLMKYGIDPNSFEAAKLATEVMGAVAASSASGGLSVSRIDGKDVVRLTASGTQSQITDVFDPESAAAVAGYNERVLKSLTTVLDNLDRSNDAIDATVAQLKSAASTGTPSVQTASLLEIARLQEIKAERATDVTAFQSIIDNANEAPIGTLTKTNVIERDVFGAPPWALVIAAGLFTAIAAAALAALVSPKPLTAGDVAASFPTLRVIGVAPGTELPSSGKFERVVTVKLGEVHRAEIARLVVEGDVDTLIVEYSSLRRYKTAAALGL